MSAPRLSKEQVQALNEKYGYFQYADAQGDKSRAFAEEAIETHRRMCDAAPELLAALDGLAALANGFSVSGVYFNEFPENVAALDQAWDAIAKARGAA